MGVDMVETEGEPDEGETGCSELDAGMKVEDAARGPGGVGDGDAGDAGDAAGDAAGGRGAAGGTSARGKHVSWGEPEASLLHGIPQGPQATPLPRVACLASQRAQRSEAAPVSSAKPAKAAARASPGGGVDQGAPSAWKRIRERNAVMACQRRTTRTPSPQPSTTSSGSTCYRRPSPQPPGTSRPDSPAEGAGDKGAQRRAGDSKHARDRKGARAVKGGAKREAGSDDGGEGVDPRLAAAGMRC